MKFTAADWSCLKGASFRGIKGSQALGTGSRLARVTLQPRVGQPRRHSSVDAARHHVTSHESRPTDRVPRWIPK